MIPLICATKDTACWDIVVSDNIGLVTMFPFITAGRVKRIFLTYRKGGQEDKGFPGR